MAKAFVSGLFSALAGMYYHGVPARHPHHTLGPRHTHNVPTHIISQTVQLLNFVDPIWHGSQVNVTRWMLFSFLFPFLFLFLSAFILTRTIATTSST